MTIAYTLSTEDLMASFRMQSQATRHPSSRMYWGFLLPLYFALLAVATSLPVALIATLAFFGTSVVYSIWSGRQTMQAYFSPEATVVQRLPSTISLSVEGVRLASEAGQLHYRWPFVRKIQRSGSYVVVVFNSLERTAIPAVAFRDGAQIDEFVALAQSLKAAQGAAPPASPTP